MDCNNVHEENYHGYTITIEMDDDYQMEEDDGIFITAHNQHYFYVERDGFMGTNYGESHNGYHVFPLYAYIHSGVALALSRDSYPFTCPWDSGQIGYVFVSQQEFESRDDAHGAASGHVSEWNDVLSGNVWGYVIEDEDGMPGDSCWGFVGDYEYCLQEARNVVDGWRWEEDQERQFHNAHCG